MIQRAGIALGRLSYDSEFSITRVDHNPDPTFLPSTNHRLVDSHTVEDIIDIFKQLVGFDTKREFNGFEVSIPISATPEQQKAFSDINRFHSSDHLQAWANLCAQLRPLYEIDIDLLFIDLTPGQVASKIASGSFNVWGWVHQSGEDAHINLGDVKSLSTHEIYDKLVAPIGLRGKK
jgi:hypothetical protein